MAEKSVKDLIDNMHNDEELSKKVLENPENFKEEYNLSPETIETLKGLDYDTLIKEKEEGTVAGGCYYGG